MVTLTGSGRAILNYVRTRYGSIDNYLDSLGFTQSKREALRKRFILESTKDRLLYKTPANDPFWTGNPAVLLPKKADSELEGTARPKRTPSMERVMRAVHLMELRDTFEAEQMGPDSAWAIVKRRLNKLAKAR